MKQYVVLEMYATTVLSVQNGLATSQALIFIDTDEAEKIS